MTIKSPERVATGSAVGSGATGVVVGAASDISGASCWHPTNNIASKISPTSHFLIPGSFMNDFLVLLFTVSKYSKLDKGGKNG
jgi:hypothetical protein